MRTELAAEPDLERGNSAPSGWAASVFVWVVAAAMFTTAVWFVRTYGNPVPFIDEWVHIDILAGTEPVTAVWLWKPHGEHRVPLAKLLWISVVKWTGSFKAGVYINVLLYGVDNQLVGSLPLDQARVGARRTNRCRPLANGCLAGAKEERIMSHLPIFTLTGTLFLVTTLASADEPDRKPSKPTDDRVKLVRGMYEKLPCKILGFVEPSNKIVTAMDGRTVMLELHDAKANKLVIHLLGKRGKTPDSLLLATGRLPPRGPEESAVYGLLLRLSSKPPAGTTNDQLELVDAVLAVLDERYCGAIPIAQEGTE